MQPSPTALWKKMWLLFTVIWVLVAGLNAMTIIAFSEGVERDKAVQPIAFGVLVPALVYAVLWLWARFSRKK
jgi:hypothetical protein